MALHLVAKLTWRASENQNEQTFHLTLTNNMKNYSLRKGRALLCFVAVSMQAMLANSLPGAYKPIENYLLPRGESTKAPTTKISHSPLKRIAEMELSPDIATIVSSTNMGAGQIVQAQQQVTGIVSDSHGALSGVVIVVKGTTITAISDTAGHYTINAPNDATLTFSFIGYSTIEIAVDGRNDVSVIMKDDPTFLEEVTVNAGYYSVKESERTGSIVKVGAKDIEKQPVSNPLAALQGRMAGVNITQGSGVSGGGFTIEIRGTNSLRSDGNSPLYIVDGMPYLSSPQANPSLFNGILTAGGPSVLNGVNPSDIESIEILKDADATAIYGSRGANGVVLITTKKGKAGKTEFSVNAYTGASHITRTLDLMNTRQYLAMRNEAFANDGFTELPEWAYDVNGTWGNRYTDWQKELIGGTAMTRNLDVGVSGGNSNTQFTLHGTTYTESTVFPGDFSYRKSSFHAGINHASDDGKFTAAFTANYTVDKNNQPGNDLSRQAVNLPPNAPELYDENGELNWANSTWVNPLSLLEEKYFVKTNTLTANGVFGYELLPGLQFRTSLGFADTRLEESRLSPNTVYDPAYGLDSSVSSSLLNNSKQQSWNIEPQLEYKREIAKGKLSVLAGATFQENLGQQLGIFGYGFSSNSLLGNLAAASTKNILYDTNNEYRYNAGFARINYGFRDRYFLNLTGRRDGSSRFGPGNRFANFGAIGAAWLWSKENFMKAVPVISFGKLRASYGSTGSDQIGDYQFLDTYGTTGSSYQGIVALEPIRLFNPNFSWETNKKLEVALDLGLFEDRIFITAAQYSNRSSSQLVGIPLPGTTGFSSIQANLGATVENKGWEFELRTVNIKSKDLHWTMSANLTIPRNKLVAFPGLEGSTYANQYVVGESINIVKVFESTGVDPQTGLYQFKDYNGDGEIHGADDRQKIIDTSPRYFGGLQNSLSYKNWQLDFLFQFVKQLGTNYTYASGVPGNFGNQPTAVISHWEQPGDHSAVQQYSAGFNDDATLAFERLAASDAAYSDASYVRLKNLSLSYTLPSSWIKMATCRLYAQGQNLLTFTHYKGLDPENQSLGALPPLRTITVGVAVSFNP